MCQEVADVLVPRRSHDKRLCLNVRYAGDCCRLNFFTANFTFCFSEMPLIVFPILLIEGALPCDAVW